MPVCFQLTRKSDVAAGPVKLVTIDEEMCAHFGAKPDEVHWHAGWFDIIGLWLATGKSFEEVKAKCNEWLITDRAKGANDEVLADDQHLIDIAVWLEEHFTTNSWYETKR